MPLDTRCACKISWCRRCVPEGYPAIANSTLGFRQFIQLCLDRNHRFVRSQHSFRAVDTPGSAALIVRNGRIESMRRNDGGESSSRDLARYVNREIDGHGKRHVRAGVAHSPERIAVSVVWIVHKCCLTVKLRGRPEAPTKRRGRILSSRARGADKLAAHGPLQRLF